MKWRFVLRHVAVVPILFYRKVISPLTPASCIYEPTCSQYALESIRSHGVIRGGAAALLRILRCVGGLFTGGDDPVPERFSLRNLLKKYRDFWRWNRRN